MQVTPRGLIVAAMVTLLFMVPEVSIVASAAIWAGVAAEVRIVFIVAASAWAVMMGRIIK